MIKSRNALIAAAVLAVTASAGYAGSRSDQRDAMQARNAELASRRFAAAQTPKQQCLNNCRVRYRDCRRLNQLPSSECRGIYQDCAQYSCTGLGPG
jgi:hypothetical protein